MNKDSSIKPANLIFSVIDSNSYFISINKDIKKISDEIDEELIIPCAIFLSKKKIEEENFNGQLELLPNYEELLQKIEPICINWILEQTPNLIDFIFTLKKVIDKINLFENNEISDEVDYMLVYFNFMISFVEALKKIYEIYFENFIRSFENNTCDNYLNLIWVIFAYLKKTILKRKNENFECIVLLSSILNEFKSEFLIEKNKLLNKENSCAEFEVYFKELSQHLNFNFCFSSNNINSHNDKNNISNNSNSYLSAHEERIKEIQNLVKKFWGENFEKNCKNKFEFFFNSIKIKYDDILILDEIDDNKIFENYFLNKKLKQTPLRSNSKSNSNINTNFTSVQSTLKQPIHSNFLPGVKNNLDASPNNFKNLSNMHSPLNLKNLSHMNNEKQIFDIFFEELNDFTFLDISYLFKKFCAFNIENNLFAYLDFYENFDQKFINAFLSKIKEEKLELCYTNHKNMYLKLADELFIQEKSKFKVHNEGFHILLNDKSFHFNFMILSYYIYFNLLLLEKTNLLEELIFQYIDNLNKYENFDFICLFKILSNLNNINLPLNIKNIIKKFQNYLVTYVLWQGDSFLFTNYLNKFDNIKNKNYKKEQGLEDEINPTVRHIIKKVFITAGSCIYKLTRTLFLDNTIREKIWLTFQYIIGENYNFLKDNFLDTLIFNIAFNVINININVHKSEEENFITFNTILSKYKDLKKSTTNDLFEKLFNITNEKFILKDMSSIDNFIYSLNEKSSDNNQLINPTHKFMSIDLDMASLLPLLQNDYNTILNISPSPIKITENNLLSNSNSKEDSQNFLHNKRIRQLTPPLSSKMLSVSPYNRKSSFTPVKNNSAFKNLNSVFSSIKKDP